MGSEGVLDGDLASFREVVVGGGTVGTENECEAGECEAGVRKGERGVSERKDFKRELDEREKRVYADMRNN